jgi:hypothetical protein
MLQKIINKFQLQKVVDKFQLQRIVTAGNGLLNSALSWTFTALGFDNDELVSLDKNVTTIENSKLVESYCARFNGSSSAIALPLDTGNVYNDGMVSFWFKKTGVYGGAYHAIYTRLAGTGLQIYIPSGDKLSFYTTAVHASTYTVDSDWHYYEITISGTSIYLTVDDVFIQEITGVTFVDLASVTSHFIGKVSTNATNGQIANFCLIIGSTKNVNLPLQKSTFDISGNVNNGSSVTDITWGTQDEFHYNITKGMDKYLDDATGLIEISVPYVNGVPVVSSVSGYTKQSSHPAGTWHNGAETKFIIGATTYDTGDSAWNISALVAAADTDFILHSASTGYGIPIAYDDLVAEQGEYLFFNVSTDNQHKDLLLFSDPVTGMNSVNVHKFIENVDNLVTDASGEYIFDINNFPIWAL